jgi:hypothetical protein
MVARMSISSKPKLILDTFCEIYPMLKNYASGEFWDFGQEEINTECIYVIGRRQFVDHREKIRELVQHNNVKIILSNPHEGSETLRGHIVALYKIDDLILQNKILLVGGGDMDSSWPCLRFDSFLSKINDYSENLAAASQSVNVWNKQNKPYKFLFLNGRGRKHRKYLINRWRSSGLLSNCLWTNLDSASGPLNLLPNEYEVERYRHRYDSVKSTGYVKFDLFDNDWGEIYLSEKQYIDTYFSVVTETVFDYPYSFRTEKIWKPIAMGHPWIAVANQGFYRDLRNLGFRTFDQLIDESFDSIEDNQTRLNAVARTVEDLSNSNLDQFMIAASEICKYNQEHFNSLSEKNRLEFPNRFFIFLKQHKWMT